MQVTHPTRQDQHSPHHHRRVTWDPKPRLWETTQGARESHPEEAHVGFLPQQGFAWPLYGGCSRHDVLIGSDSEPMRFCLVGSTRALVNPYHFLSKHLHFIFIFF